MTWCLQGLKFDADLIFVEVIQFQKTMKLKMKHIYKLTIPIYFPKDFLSFRVCVL